MIDLVVQIYLSYLYYRQNIIEIILNFNCFILFFEFTIEMKNIYCSSFQPKTKLNNIKASRIFFKKLRKPSLLLC